MKLTSSPPAPTSPPAVDTAAVDAPLHLLGFKFEDVTPTFVSGRLLVTEKCCQPFKVLHGGVSAMIGEGMASTGAVLNCGVKRAAGVQLSTNHHKTATVGDLLVAQATPVSAGGTIQVWEVKIWKTDPSNTTSKTLVSTSRLTILCNMPFPDHAKGYGDHLRKHSKL